VRVKVLFPLTLTLSRRGREDKPLTLTLSRKGREDKPLTLTLSRRGREDRGMWLSAAEERGHAPSPDLHKGTGDRSTLP